MKYLSLVMCAAFLSACVGGTQLSASRLQSTFSGVPEQQAVPREYKNFVKVGKPYTIMGKTYYPKYEPDYNEVGVASWYGPGFHGKRTANGEIFNENGFTAAHTTLPMPSLVQVVNLENGRNLVVRINDRGPFKDDRIIDLSKASARELGVLQNGIARVRVKYLEEATKDYLANVTGNSNIQTAGDVFGVQPAQSMQQPVIKDAYGNVYTPPQQETLANLQPLNQNLFAQPQPVNGFGQPVNVQPMQQITPQPVQPLAPVKAQPVVESTEVLKVPSASASNKITKVDLAGATIKENSVIQVASFSKSENADKLALKLVDHADVNISEVSVNGRIWHRVRIGPIENPTQVTKLLSKVKDMGFSDAKIIK